MKTLFHIEKDKFYSLNSCVCILWLSVCIIFYYSNKIYNNERLLHCSLVEENICMGKGEGPESDSVAAVPYISSANIWLLNLLEEYFKTFVYALLTQ